MNTFEQFNLPKSLQKAIDELGITTPTPIQQKSFAVIMSGRDVMGIAQTGTGKTLAYLLPILKQWKFQETHTPRVLILVPTRELVVQVAEVVESLTQYMSIRTLGVYGGVNINTQKKAVYEGVDILVGTPGRTMDLALDKVVRFDCLQKLIIEQTIPTTSNSQYIVPQNYLISSYNYPDNSWMYPQVCHIPSVPMYEFS